MGPIRQRKALSCVDCRRRKVKCDRTLPICKRCQKSSNADNCVYVPYSGPIPTPSDTSPGQLRNTAGEDIDDLVSPWGRESHIQRTAIGAAPTTTAHPTEKSPETEKKILEKLLPRVIELETYVRSAGSKPVSAEMMFGIGNPVGPGYDAERNPMSDYDKVMVRGKSFSTQYFGPSYPISMLLQFDELSKFVKEIVQSMPDLENAKKSMSNIRTTTRSIIKPTLSCELNTLINMVPPREMADKLIKRYLDTFETTYRVLHIPSFLRDYEAFWQDPPTARAETIIQLLAAVSTVYCIVPGGPPGFVGRSSARREVASRWISTCDMWLAERSKKHITLGDLQIHILLYISREMNCIKIKRTWTNIGQLLRLAMAAGMHREPSLLCKKINHFDCEMRRRLWFTIVELDLQATTARGMTPSIDSMGWDCLPPRNIHDAEFDESSDSIPPSRPNTEFTRTSFLSYINGHLALRCEILGRVNSIRLGVDFETVMQYDNKLRKLIDELPSWEGEPESDFADKERVLMLYEFILILHVPFVAQTTNKSKYFYSTASKRDACIKTLQIYSSLSDEDRLHSSNWREDYSRAVLALCHDLVTNVEDAALYNRTQTFEMISVVVDVLGKRVETLGQGFHSFWVATTAYTLLQWKLLPSENRNDYAKKAANRVIQVFTETVMSTQVPLPSLNGVVMDDAGTLATNTSDSTSGAASEAFPDFEALNGIAEPWDFLNFDFSTIWNMDTFNDF